MAMASPRDTSFLQSLLRTLISGLLVVAPIYLAVLLLLKAMSSLAGLVRPIAELLPDWLPADQILSLLLALIGCFLIGAWLRTRTGRRVWDVIEKTLFQKTPDVRELAQPYAAIGGGEPRSRVEAGAR